MVQEEGARHDKRAPCRMVSQQIVWLRVATTILKLGAGLLYLSYRGILRMLMTFLVYLANIVACAPQHVCLSAARSRSTASEVYVAAVVAPVM